MRDFLPGRLGALAVCVVLQSCSSAPSGSAPDAGSVSAGSDAANVNPSSVTFHKDVEPIVQKTCQPCHVSGGIAPFALATYADAKAYADLIVAQTSAGTMPPWAAVETSECTPGYGWKDDIRLSSASIALIKAWRDQGSVEGDPKDAPPPVVPKPLALDGAQLVLSPAAPYSLVDGPEDQFRCFVLDPKLTQPSYVNGTFIVPGNSTVVHHALVFADTGAASKALITDSATGSYDCFGGPGFSNTTLVAAWAPGSVPVEYPADVGAELAPGSLLVMQVHYHPHSATAVPGPDQTKFQVRFAASTPGHLATAMLLGNFASAAATTGLFAGTGLLPGPDDPPAGPVFDIPPGVRGHTETMQVTVPATSPPLQIVGVAGHQHYVGSAVEISVTRTNAQESAAPAQECLLSIPTWNFDWQRFYMYDATLDRLPKVMAGDVVQIKCTYDNTLQNTQLAASLAFRGLSQPQDVKLGETTLDEMCLGAFLVIQ